VTARQEQGTDDESASSPIEPPDIRSDGFLGLVDDFDRRVDAWFELARGNSALDGAAKLITGFGDHGLMWAVTAAWRARHTGPQRAQAVRALAVAGVESSLVNAFIKSQIGRARPDQSGLQLTEGGVPVREPKTSSFPSGHTLAAFCSATIMSQRNDRPGNALLFAGATLVGVSRLHLRAHHASDVVGGAAIGTVLGLVGRTLL
jgi:membrane-associated phospholipid phosphatase